MTAHVKPKMTVDDFVIWAEGRPGRYELVNGEIIAMSPERARHAEVKYAVQSALARAIRDAGVPCRMLPDGMTVRISQATAFEPDALVYCGPRLPPDAVEVSEPVIVVEVLSPSTRGYDAGGKLAGYFLVPTVEHYLILDPERAVAVHHRRAGAIVETRIVSGGTVALDPPGIEIAVADLFAEG